jgi:hypothetical protein
VSAGATKYQTKAGHYKGALGSGTRFANCIKSGATRAQCAFRGRQAHGAKTMARLSAKGRSGK